MTKTQRNLVYALVSFLFYALFTYRKDLFIFAGRPRINAFFSLYLNDWGSGIFLTISLCFLFSIFNVSWYKVLAVIGILEGLIVSLLYFGPSFLPNSFKTSYLGIRMKGVAANNKSMIQFEKDCAQYDSTLFYTLRPGKSEFNCYEFNNLYTVNSLGFRDSETDLNKPEVAFLGDSFTMGWGIDQDSTFSEIFQQASKLRCINTGVSSYGTAREYFNFKKLDRSNLKLLIIQFHDTDMEENNYFKKYKKFGKRTFEEYKGQVQTNSVKIKYHPLKYLKSFLTTLMVKTGKSVHQGYPPTLSNDFYYYIDLIRKDYKGPILITYIGSFQTNAMVVADFEKNLGGRENIFFQDLSKDLNTSHYFYFDDHINAFGHKIVAQKLLEACTKKGIIQL